MVVNDKGLSLVWTVSEAYRERAEPGELAEHLTALLSLQTLLQQSSPCSCRDRTIPFSEPGPEIKWHKPHLIFTVKVIHMSPMSILRAKSFCH